MKHTLLLILGLFFSILMAVGQEQWASRVVKYSSQAGTKSYAAKQVLGKPNALQYGKNPVSWAPQSSNLGIEYIEVAFDKPSKVQQVAVWENFNTGSVYQIILIEPNGKAHTVYENNKLNKIPANAGMFRHFMKMTSYNVSSLKLVLNTAEIYGLNQIDAIAISSSSTPVRPTINNPRDKSYVGKPENLGYEVNCDAPDLLPIISVDGQTLYFARKNYHENFGVAKKDDIYVSHKTKRGTWGNAANIGSPLNNEYNNFVCAVNPDGTEVLISGKYDRDGKFQEGLHTTSLKNGVWSEPKRIRIDNYYNKSPFVCYHVSPDMKYLVIAMENDNTHGDMDIYVSFRKSNGDYTAPKNLGTTINTAGTEPSVFLSADEKTIYFSSDGHPGYGAYDMYMSRRMDNSWTKWSEPVNLGDKINTSDWDLYYTVPANGEYAYYSSEHNSYGRSDLYRIKLPKDVRPEPVAILKPTFVNVKTNTPIANLDKRNATIIVNDDSKVNLYEEIKGYYPINETEDLSAELEEEDNVQDQNEKAELDAKTNATDEKMEDLLARLESLKNEQAQTSNKIETNEEEPIAAKKTPTTNIKRNEPTTYSSDLDDRLAALRSDMYKIDNGEEPDNVIEKDPVTKEYRVNPSVKSTAKLDAREQQLNQDLEDNLSKYDRQYDAINAYNEEVGGRDVTPRATVKKTYDLKEKDHDDYLNEHQSYRDKIEALKLNKEKAAYERQPLTKYALKSTAIDQETSDQLVASSLKSELSNIRDQQPEDQAVAYNPELDEYKKKLDELKKKQNTPVASESETGTRITRPKKGENTGGNDAKEQPEELNEEVLAYQEKLEALKNKMNDLPSSTEVEKVKQDQKNIEAIEKELSAEINDQPTSTETAGDISTTKVKKPRGKKSNVVAPEVVAIVLPTEQKEEKTNTEYTDKSLAEVKEPTQQLEEEEATLSQKKVDSDEILKEKEALANALDDDIAQLNEEAKAAEKAKLDVLEEKAVIEEAKQDTEREKAALEQEKIEMEKQKEELQDVIAQLEAERQQFLAEKQKIENDKKLLEELRLQQHQQVKKLEGEIQQLEREKGKAQNEVALAKSNNTIVSNAPIDKEMFLMPIEEGVTVEIRNVFFNANSAYIKPSSYKELDKVASFLKVNNNITVEIGGHTNGVCQTDYCNSLSLKRASSVRNYLVNKGVPTVRVHGKGYGKAKPIATNDTSDGRKKNQRVELKILKVE